MNAPPKYRLAIGRWLVVAAALLLDTLFGDLPNRWHPVAWMGSTIAAARRYAPATGAAAQFAYSAIVALGGALAMAALGHLTTKLCRRLPRPFGWLLEAALLKQTVALRGLSQAAQGVYLPLAQGNEEEARRQLSWHLVSRDTTTLDTPRIAAATIESVAENSSDGVIAPLFAYATLGLPGAFAYRWLNTVDSMWGYRDPAHEWLGKVGARADDVANWLPARLTALLILAAASIHAPKGQMATNSPHRTWHIWRRDAGLTASPNAGHPMSAMAGALGVELEKVGHYKLGAGLSLPQPSDIPATVTLMRGAVITGLIVSGVLYAATVLAQKLAARNRNH